jgi:hypothetical protein
MIRTACGWFARACPRIDARLPYPHGVRMVCARLPAPAPAHRRAPALSARHADERTKKTRQGKSLTG